MAKLKIYTYKDERGNEITQKLSEEDARVLGLVKEPAAQTKKKTTSKNKAR